jgi:hypothetical protein
MPESQDACMIVDADCVKTYSHRDACEDGSERVCIGSLKPRHTSRCFTAMEPRSGCVKEIWKRA